jgi:predicted nucleotidyltransferase component of viral defense system
MRPHTLRSGCFRSMSENSEPAQSADKDVDTEAVEYVDVDVRAWVEAARTDPLRYRDRQVTEIVLTTIGIAPSLKDALVLKGGTLMALAFKSDRLTGDVDFTAQVDPDGFEEKLVTELNDLMPRTAIQLGYLDLMCRVQSVEKKPRAENFLNWDFPALVVRVGSAKRGTRQEEMLEEGRAARVHQLEISFRDQVYAFQELYLTDAGVAVHGFTSCELIAEKFRALLQQPIRKRNRRQDVFDIAYLTDTHEFSDEDRRVIHKTLVSKCKSRGIEPKRDSLENEDVINRARADWETLQLELKELPPFDERFRRVKELYEALPW